MGQETNMQFLVERCREGDQRACCKVYEQYASAMYTVCKRFVSDAQLAEDLMQEGFIKAFSNLQQFQGKSSFGAWLKRIVINRCLDEVQKKRPEFTDLPAEDLVEEEKEEPFSDVLNPEVIKRAVNELPEGYRVIFNLFLVEGYSHDEIGGMLGISSSTSRSQFTRAKQKLRTTLMESMHV